MVKVVVLGKVKWGWLLGRDFGFGRFLSLEVGDIEGGSLLN